MRFGGIVGSVWRTSDPATGSDSDRGFVAFYRAEYPAAVRLAAALSLSTTAEDAVQEAFTRLYGRFSLLDNPAAYLRTTLVSVIREGHRRRQREQRRLRLVDRPVTIGTVGSSEVLDVVARLPDRQRHVLVLRYWAGWSEAEIAAALGCRPGTVKSLSSRALERLKKDLDS
jgi:DNA-directed RNA polymerase specialized sigma24 family protein